MADWNKPSLTDLYTNFRAYMSDRLNDVATMFDSLLTAPTNLPVGAKRWNDTNKKWEVWSGSAWSDMATTYGIAISGNAETATTATTATKLADGNKGDITSTNGTITINANSVGMTKLARLGSAGQVLTSNGTSQDPSYQTLPVIPTDENIQDAVASMFTGGTHSQISFSYNDSVGTLNATVGTVANATRATNATNAGNADTVDGYHASSLAKANHDFDWVSVGTCPPYGTVNATTSWGHGLYVVNNSASLLASSPAQNLIISSGDGTTITIYKLRKL